MFVFDSHSTFIDCELLQGSFYFSYVFSGVSCDSCLKNNFRGRRYKCLICIDYDLCATCYESGAVTNQHTTEHPMQCILTRSDFGEKIREIISVMTDMT